MAVIKSGASSDQLTIDATSKAARVTLYDTTGSPYGFAKATYHAAVGATNTAAGTGVFFNIIGSATKTIKIHRIMVSGTVATAATHSCVLLTKRTSSIASGGASTILTGVANDSTSAAATAVVRYYTTLGTAGTGGGLLMAQTDFFPITATATNSPSWIQFIAQMDTGAETQDFVLRGALESLELSFAATTTNAPTLSIYVTWTEE